MGQFSQGLDPGPAQGLTQASPGQFFGQDFGQTEQQKQQHSLQQQRGARAKRARPFVVSVPAVASVVLFDQSLDQKLTWAGLGWPGSNPGLAQVKPWAGPRSSPGLGQGQALGWALGKWAPLQPRWRGACSDGGLRTGYKIDTAMYGPRKLKMAGQAMA